MVVGEIREHDEFRGKGHDCYHVRFCHLLFHESCSGVVCANQVVRLHGCQVEEKNNQATVAQLIANRVGRRRIRSSVIHRHNNGFVFCRCR